MGTAGGLDSSVVVQTGQSLLLGIGAICGNGAYGEVGVKPRSGDTEGDRPVLDPPPDPLKSTWRFRREAC